MQSGPRKKPARWGQVRALGTSRHSSRRSLGMTTHALYPKEFFKLTSPKRTSVLHTGVSGDCRDLTRLRPNGAAD
jgi:hypothetical protein